MNLRNLYNGTIYYYLKPKINIDNDKSHINNNLENLFKQYGTDKANSIANRIGHVYTKFYLKHLKNFKKKNINILEIGSYSGASAAAFSKFFRKAKIFCLDINISNFKYRSKKIKVFALDAATNGWNNQWSKYLNEFEKKFAEYVGVKYAIATSSCTGALHISLNALGIGPGDEVIVPEVTWVASANAIRYVGATPVFADIDKNIDIYVNFNYAVYFYKTPLVYQKNGDTENSNYWSENKTFNSILKTKNKLLGMDTNPEYVLLITYNIAFFMNYLVGFLIFVFICWVLYYFFSRIYSTKKIFRIINKNNR